MAKDNDTEGEQSLIIDDEITHFNSSKSFINKLFIQTDKKI
jgi:hypothetical protein